MAILVCQDSDWATLRACSDTLASLEVTHMAQVLATPAAAVAFAPEAEARGIEVFVAGGVGLPWLATTLAAHSTRPVLAVPSASVPLNGLDNLAAAVRSPNGAPIGSLAIGEAGAVNAGLLAAAILALSRPDLARRLQDQRAEQTLRVLAAELPDVPTVVP